ncbi:MAG: MBL fold metallo-hydrolase [Verrucomicrobia bacterium]|nr:MBL fold metallo-hydrolase [Verrucomicrobiota bacterium]
MLHLSVLASGSSGNCALVETASTRILVDAGLSARKIAKKLEILNIQAASIDGILLTHEHSDHSQGVGVWARRHGTPIYANSLTAEALKQDSEGVQWRIFTTGSDFDLGDLRVQSFSIPHDAAEPVGFVLRHESHAVGFLTDLGYATRAALERVRSVHTLLIEANHDETMLHNDTKRPWAIKQRILSRHGHLSNNAAAEVLAEVIGGGIRRALLGHLSDDCNTPDLALRTVRERLTQGGGRDIEILCAAPADVPARLLVG